MAMRRFLLSAAAAIVAVCSTPSFAQDTSTSEPTNYVEAQEPTPAGQGECPEGSGEDCRVQAQPSPQGDPGPTNTTSGGASPHSPQGETPPGMQTPIQGSPEEAVDGDDTNLNTPTK
jgi:hypothetical protein